MKDKSYDDKMCFIIEGRRNTMIENLEVLADVEKIYKKIQYYGEEKNEYKELEIAYILANPKDEKDICAFVAIKESTDVFVFNPYKDQKAKCAIGFTFEEYLFDYLKDYEIVKMSKDTHICVWYSIMEDFRNNEFLHEKLPEYLNYCKKNNISAKTLFGEDAKENDIMIFYPNDMDAKTKKSEPER